MKELVINWHITEACNFKCQYCFAKWDKPCKKELFHNSLQVSNLLDQILLLSNRFKGFDSIRLNLVGGEIFLYRDAIINIIAEAKKRDMKLSTITNGSLLDYNLNKIIANNFDIIGFSIDSIKDLTNIAIGRKTSKEPISIEKTINNINMIRSLNPNIVIKINTVVNKFNYHENMSEFIASVSPQKWKVFKVLPIINRKLDITNEEFSMFLETHKSFHSIISSENNDEMVHSYLMIDPLGRFFQNEPNNFGYQYSQSILDVGVVEALKEISFDIAKFNARYKNE